MLPVGRRPDGGVPRLKNTNGGGSCKCPFFGRTFAIKEKMLQSAKMQCYAIAVGMPGYIASPAYQRAETPG